MKSPPQTLEPDCQASATLTPGSMMYYPFIPKEDEVKGQGPMLVLQVDGLRAKERIR